MIICTNILVAIDFSPASDKALLYGRELARFLGAKLHVIHVVGDMITAGMLPPTYVPEIGCAQRVLEDSARARLQALVEDGADRGAAPTVVVRVASSPAAEILAYVKDNPITLVVVGSHGHQSAVAHLLLGSVAEKVVRAAVCPVLTVRPFERDFVRAGTASRTLSATG